MRIFEKDFWRHTVKDYVDVPNSPDEYLWILELYFIVFAIVILWIIVRYIKKRRLESKDGL